MLKDCRGGTRNTHGGLSRRHPGEGKRAEADWPVLAPGSERRGRQAPSELGDGIGDLRRRHESCPIGEQSTEEETKARHQVEDQRDDHDAHAHAVWNDPMARVLLQMHTPQASTQPAATLPSAVLEQIAIQLVRRIGVGASGVQLEFSAGALEGGVLSVQAGADGLDIALSVPPGVDATSMSQAIAARLERKGIRVACLTVD